MLSRDVAVTQGPEVMAVLQAMERWSQGSADPSLVRSFIFQALAVAAPPYSPEFAATLIRSHPSLTICISYNSFISGSYVI